MLPRPQATRLMNSLVSVPSTKCPSIFPLHGTFVCFKNSCRIHYNNAHHAKFLVCASNALKLSHSTDYGLPIEENRSENLVSDKAASRFRVEKLVGRIRVLPSKGRSETINNWRQNGEFETVAEFNDLLMALLFVDDSELALKLFDEMPSQGFKADSWTLSVVIRCHCKNKDFVAAERVLGYMLDNGLHLKFSTITVLIKSLSRSGRLQRALRVLEVAGGIGFKPMVKTYNCLLKGLCYVGRVEEAYEMLMKMKKEDSKPDMYSYTAVMDGFCKVGRSDEAVELLDEALEMGLTPDAVAFNTLFNGYCIEGRPLMGIGLLKKMKERNCSPDYICYSTLLHGLLKWGHPRTALQIYEEMVGIGLKVKDKMTNSLVRGLCRISCKGKDFLEKALQVFKKMKYEDSVIEPSTYDVMIGTLCMGKKTNEASVNLQKMIRKGYAPRMITFNGVIQALCSEGKVIEALSVLVVLNEGGRVPSRPCYNLLIDELNQHGSLLGASNVYGAALKRGVLPSKTPLQ